MDKTPGIEVLREAVEPPVSAKPKGNGSRVPV